MKIEGGQAMKRFLPLILALVLVLIAAAGCASASTTGQENWQPTAATTFATTTAGQGGDYLNPGQSDVSAAQRKVIKDAQLDLQVKDVPSAYDQLLGYAVENGGYEISRMQQRSNGYITIDAQIKIDPAKLDAFLAFAATLGDVINTQITTSDITDNYYDTKTRLDTMEKTLATYYDFLRKAANINESLDVQSRIDQLTVEIESLKGRLALWDSLLAQSTVTVRLRQVEDPVKLKKNINWSTLSFSDMGYLMQAGLTSVVNFLVSALQWLAIALVVTAPLWIVALVIMILVHRANKKKKAKIQQAINGAGKSPDGPAQG
jgi:hypothetical protein